MASANQSSPPVASLPPKYRPADHEPQVRDRWDKAGAFHPDPARVKSGQRRPYSIFIPPPNVTARLHLGHALNNTLQDILARAHRMMGFETLWMPGTDHAGIATQTVVEQRILKEEGKRRTDFERADFVARVQAWKDEYEAAITDQLKKMGCSCDWDRQRFTMDDICARAVREAFFALFKDGLIYRGKRLVNWDPVTQTALADDEVEMEEVDGKFFYLRYPIVRSVSRPTPVTWSELAAAGFPGAESLPDDEPAFVTVATTRPETYLGDTAVAINPHDPRANALQGLFVQLPLVGRIIPIIRDDYVVMPARDPEAEGVDPKARFATGYLKVTPAHDPNDWDIGRRHDLAVINVMAPDASISEKHGWTDIGDAHIFVGLSREAAREKVLAEFKSRLLLENIRPYRHSVGHSYRSHAAIEPYLSDQWYCKVSDDRLRGFAQRALRTDQRSSTEHRPHKGTEGDGELRFHPTRYAKTFEAWHDNLRDWCISRQLWWGHQIPVWRPRVRQIDRLSTEELGARIEVLLKLQREGRIAIQYRGEHARLETVERADFDLSVLFVCVRDPDGLDSDIVRTLESQDFERDGDVLDTWFSSALWPLSTLGWPEPPQDMSGLLDAFNPSNVLCTAREIITLWVSRMVMFNRYFTSPDGGKTPGQLPFRDVFIHAMIQDGEGRKMSKSLGNGVDPLDIIESHGSDAMRFTLCQMTTQTQDVRMPVEHDASTGKNTSPKFDFGRNFCSKLWNATRFALMNLEGSAHQSDAVTFADLSLVDRWMLSRVAASIDKINQSLQDYQFSAYAQTVYDLLWRDFCDWYLEAIKPTVKHSAGQSAVLRNTLDTILRLLHPICPFITEVLAEPLRQTQTGHIAGLALGGAAGGDLLCCAAWPQVSPDLSNPEAESAFEKLRTLVSAIREARSTKNIDTKRRITLHVDAAIAGAIKAGGGIVETLALLESVTTTPAPTEGASATFLFEAKELALSGLADAVDPAVEKVALADSIAKLEKDILVIEKRLSNPGYADKAPAKLVQETRGQMAQKRAERDAAERRLKELA